MDLLHFLRWWAHVNHTDEIEGALSAGFRAYAICRFLAYAL
jgi:hypothetical protein